MITASNLYVVDPPTNQCNDGTTSKNFCKWTSSSYGTVVTPPTDTQAPSVTITSPVNGQQVSGTVVVSATATDDIGVSKVEFLIDGTLKQTSSSAPYSYSFASSSLSVGNHTIVVKAYDAAGNVGTKSLTVSTTSTAPTVVCDFDGDGKVGVIDLSKLLSNYGKSVTANTNGDCDGNAKVDVTDLSMLLSRYGK